MVDDDDEVRTLVAAAAANDPSPDRPLSRSDDNMRPFNHEKKYRAHQGHVESHDCMTFSRVVIPAEIASA